MSAEIYKSMSSSNNSNMLKSPINTSNKYAAMANNSLPQIESINDDFQISIDFKLTDTVGGGTYSS